MRVDLRTVVLSNRDAAGLVTFQPDFYGAAPDDEGEKPGGNSYPAVFPFGLSARPRDPSGDDHASLDACEALVFELGYGAEGRVMPTTDARYLGVVPDPGTGGTVLFCVTDDGSHKDATYQRLAGDGVQGVKAGSYQLRVPYQGGQKAHLIEVDLTAREIRITHGEGASVKLTDTDVTIAAPKGNLNISSQGGMVLDAPGGASVGGAGGKPIMVDDGRVAAAWTQIQAGFAALGQTFTPPTGYTATLASAK